MAKRLTDEEREALGGSVYDRQYFTDDELRQAAAVRADAQAGRTSWDDANRYVEGIRSNYGYAGGKDGSGYTRLGSSPNVPSYVNRYDAQINQALDAILGARPFNYNYKEDPLYLQYEDAYTRNGQRAMQDTLAQVSARTGGLASSYANQASQQTYDEYMKDLTAKIPELWQAAYGMYRDDQGANRDNLSLLLNMEGNDYGRYMDRLGQYNTDRSFNYNVEQDKLAAAAKDKSEAQARVEAYISAGGDPSKLPADLVTQSGYTTQEMKQLQTAAAKKAAGKGKSGTTRSASYKTAVSKAGEFLEASGMDSAKKYLETLVDGGYITPDEALEIFEVELGGQTSQIEEQVPAALSESEFNRSTSMQERYGTYENYLDFVRQMNARR